MQVVSATTAPLQSTEMIILRASGVILQQVPTCVRAMLPSLAHGGSHASDISLSRSLFVGSRAHLSILCFKFGYECSSLVPRSQTFHRSACAAAASIACIHIMNNDETEGNPYTQKQAENSSQVSNEMSPKFAESLQAFDVLHAHQRVPGASNGMGLDALEASLLSMEGLMSSTSPHEYWHLGSSWLKLAWLYSEAPESTKTAASKVIASGHQALKFLDALQMPVWTIVSCCYVLGRAYARMENFEDAVFQLKRASSMFEDLGQRGAPNPEQSHLVNAVSSLLQDTKIRFGQHLCTHVKEFLIGERDPQAFLSHVTEALELVKAKVDCHSMSIAAQHENCLGIFYLQSRQADEALPHFRNALSKITKLHGPGSSKVAIAHNHLGVAYTELFKLHDALKHFGLAKNILSQGTLEKGDGTEVTLYNNIAQVYALRGRFDDAVMAQKRLIEIIKQNMKDSIQTPFVLDAAEDTLQEMIQQANERRKS